MVIDDLTEDFLDSLEEFEDFLHVLKMNSWNYYQKMNRYFLFGLQLGVVSLFSI